MLNQQNRQQQPLKIQHAIFTIFVVDVLLLAAIGFWFRAHAQF